MGSYVGEYKGSNGESGGAPGTKIPPLKPLSNAHLISSTEPLTSPRKICATPARLSGASETKSANQRLWALKPAHLFSKSSL